VTLLFPMEDQVWALVQCFGINFQKIVYKNGQISSGSLGERIGLPAQLQAAKMTPLSLSNLTLPRELPGPRHQVNHVCEKTWNDSPKCWI